MLIRRSSSQQSLCDLHCHSAIQLSRPNFIKSKPSQTVFAKLRAKKVTSFNFPIPLKEGEWNISTKAGRDKSMMLLNMLAVLYGLGNVLPKYVENTSLNSAVKYTAATLVFLPFFQRSRECCPKHVRAGLELGLWTFVHSILNGLSPSSTDPYSTSLIYTLTTFSAPIMQLYTGRPSKVTWLAIVTSLSGMGVLEEEGNGWKGIKLPSLTNSWATLDALLSILQVLRSEALARNCDPVKLNTIQLAALSIFNTMLELLLHPATFVDDLQRIPWYPAVFSGVLCVGLAGLIEIRGLKGVEASTIAITQIMIPVWGALFSLPQQVHSIQEYAVLLWVVLTFASLFSFIGNSASKETDKSETYGGSRLVVVMISCQLKFPYYASQAQALLADMDKNLRSSGLLNPYNVSSKFESARAAFEGVDMLHVLGDAVHSISTILV